MNTPASMHDRAAQPRTAFPAAPALGDVLPPVRVRTGVAGFAYRYPTMAIGLVLLALMLLIAIF
ncbi:MAG: ABC transporter permease, partial [Betaproteobacteria bacterium]|nr:ABC transporter permease [Betaproteobacteria bacterium]